MITLMGMTTAAGTEVSGAGASTVRIPSTESVEMIVVTSISAGSLKMKQSFVQCLYTQCASIANIDMNVRYAMCQFLSSVSIIEKASCKLSAVFLAAGIKIV